MLNVAVHKVTTCMLPIQPAGEAEENYIHSEIK